MSTDNPFNVLLVIDMSEVEYLGVDHPIHTADKTETIKECFEILGKTKGCRWQGSDFDCAEDAPWSML